MEGVTNTAADDVCSGDQFQGSHFEVRDELNAVQEAEIATGGEDHEVSLPLGASSQLLIITDGEDELTGQDCGGGGGGGWRSLLSRCWALRKTWLAVETTMLFKLAFPSVS